VQAVAKQPESAQRMAGAVSKSTGSHATQVVVRGFTGLQPTVAEVIQRLDGYGVFQNVHLRSTRDSVVAEQLVDEFELECSYAE
ncbi:MAG: PilN domain-containing protein, partial [Pirellula sp.]